LIPSKQIESLKRERGLVSLVQEFVPSLEQQGAEFKGLCPLHDERTGSFTIRQEDDGVFMFHCFGCQANGNLLQLVQKVNNLSWPQAVEKCQQFLGWREGSERVEKTFKSIAKKEEAVTIPVEQLYPAERALENTPAALQWLAGRGISLETAKKFRLGFVQSAKAVNPHHTWVDQGWIVFPTIDGDQITALKYRSIQGKKHPETGEEGFLYKKGMKPSLFNLRGVDPFSDVFVVEGEPDAMVLTQAGFTAVAYPSASYNPTADEKDKLLAASRIFLAGDSDVPGQTAMTKLWNELRERTFKLEWPLGMKDANETFLRGSNSDLGVFKATVETAMARGLEQPMPFMFDIRESFRQADSTKPMERADRLRFPWPQIDGWGAIVPGDVVAVSATETGQGKTSWLMNVLLYNAVKFGRIPANYSGEVLPPQYARRAAAYLLNKPKDDIAKEDFDAAAALMGDSRFYVGYKPGANWKEVVELLIWAKRRLGADIVVIDHLHFLTRNERDENKAQADAMRMIKDMALDYNVIAIVVGQPRKALPQHRGRQMVTQDLKGSEAFGSDASQVFLLHRDRKSTGEDQNIPIFDPVTTVKLDKSRESEPRATKLYFDGARCTFGLLERKYEEYDV